MAMSGIGSLARSTPELLRLVASRKASYSFAKAAEPARQREILKLAARGGENEAFAASAVAAVPRRKCHRLR